MSISSQRMQVGWVGSVGLCAMLLSGALVAEEGAEAPLSLWTSNAPIESVLEQVVGSDVFDVRFGEGVEGLVSGRLEGTVSEVLEPLLDRYLLSVHNDGSTVWFDRRDREVSELVEFDPEREPALADWAARELDEDAPGRKGRVSREQGGLLVSGSRSFVQSTLARLDAARGVLSEASAQASSRPLSEADAAAASDDAAAIADISASGSSTVAATPVWREPPETLAMPDADPAAGEDTLVGTGAPFRSVTDIPGYHTEYR